VAFLLALFSRATLSDPGEKDLVLFALIFIGADFRSLVCFSRFDFITLTGAVQVLALATILPFLGPDVHLYFLTVLSAERPQVVFAASISSRKYIIFSYFCELLCLRPVLCDWLD
jgi:hypothetical protein